LPEKEAWIKVTIVGYYPGREAELENYGLTEFDPAAMAEVDAEEFNKYEDLHTIVDFFEDSKPHSVTFEPVTDKTCYTLPNGECVSEEVCIHSQRGFWV
jgi:hypothetical protein